MKYVVIIYFLFFTFCSSVKNPNINQSDDFVPNAETAIKIAEAIWLPIYGDKILKNKPYQASLKDNIWIVEGTLPKGYRGGVPYIEIRKNDCKILKVTHGK